MNADNYHPQHYSHWQIEPWDFIMANKLDFMRGNVIKYIMRYDQKNGVEDLLKAKTYLDKLIAVTGEERKKENTSDQSLGIVWHVSTANITPDDERLLAKASYEPATGKGNPFIIRKEGGYYISVNPEINIGSAFPSALSKDFFRLYAYAAKCFVELIDIDKDADPAPDFTTFDW